jgi:hypothetical protein
MMVYIVIWLHFIADFIFQSRKMAENKSRSLLYLTYHCIEYTLFLLPLGLKYATINGVCHFITDFITSKLTTKYYLAKNNKMFFIIIGLDQAIHMTILIFTLRWASESFISRIF